MQDISNARGLVKICGLKSLPSLNAAITKGADLIGVVFHDRSRHNVDFQTAASLADAARGRVKSVAVVVDENDAFFENLIRRVNPDMIQLHGKETPRRVAEISAKYCKPLIKALGVSDKTDFEAMDAYLPLCAMLLVEAKKDDGAPAGGSGRAIDWRILQSCPHTSRLMLAGGLNPDNVRDAIALSGVRAVDVSSGIESAPAVKDEQKIAAFIDAAREAYRRAPSFESVE